jgi:hypothetical protein
MALFNDFYYEDLSLYSLNFGTIVLLPKCKETTKILQYITLFDEIGQEVQNVHSVMGMKLFSICFLLSLCYISMESIANYF